jgi:hypothetical protein
MEFGIIEEENSSSLADISRPGVFLDKNLCHREFE